MVVEYLKSTDSKIEANKKINASIDKINENTSLLGQKANTSVVDAALELKADVVNVLNKTQITNCILSVEELVKVEPLTNGRLELKAGSVVYVSTNGTFNEVKISSNVSAGSTGLFTAAGTRELFCCYVPSKNELVNIPVNETYTQNTAPTTFLANLYGGWYDTTNKIMKYTYDAGVTWTVCSLPFAMGTPSTISADGTGWVGNIKQIFNGYGYVGQYTFTTRGLKYLIPNGRNTDKTLKNIEVNTSSLTLLSSIGNSSKIGFLNDQYSLSTYGVTNYFVQDTPPTGFTGSAKWLNTEENLMYATSDSGNTWRLSSGTYFGIITKAGNGNITEFEPNKPVELVKKGDIEKNLVEVADYVVSTYENGNSWKEKWASGKILQGGLVSIPSGAVGRQQTINLLENFSNDTYSTIGLEFGTTGAKDDYTNVIRVISQTTSSFTIVVGVANATSWRWISRGK